MPVKSCAASSGGTCKAMSEKRIENMLSAYLDGELTQAEQQRVRIHLENSPAAQEELRQLRTLKKATSELAFHPPPDDRMDALEQRLSVKAPRRLGWVLFVIGAVACVLYSGYLFATSDMYWVRKGIFGSIHVGLLLVLASVARQRILELPHDRYRGVKR